MVPESQSLNWAREKINIIEAFGVSMHRRLFNVPNLALSREKNLVLILLAILVALVLWNSFWMLWRLALFAVTVYAIYHVLKHYL
jgi:hypothetical protein